jgi:branched-chain amino acid transport system ATP-binding protein
MGGGSWVKPAKHPVHPTKSVQEVQVLRGQQVSRRFGGILAVNNVDFQIGRKEIVALIGPNGAGKTTLFNLISGMFPVSSGQVFFQDREITRLKMHQVQRMGISRTFQLVRPFMEMTALENVMVGMLFGREKPLGVAEARQRAPRYLDMVGMSHKIGRKAKELTFAERKTVELALALATKPSLILLDEFIAGMNPTEAVWASNRMKMIRDELDISLFWVEHVMSAVMEISDRIIVLNYGEKIAEGTPAEIARNEKVIDAYLGSARETGREATNASQG